MEHTAPPPEQTAVQSEISLLPCTPLGSHDGELQAMLLGQEWPLAICEEILELHARAIDHPLFAAIQGLGDVRRVMEHHVWAVWDFMTALCAVQDSLSARSLPWLPPLDRRSNRFLNELLLEEESGFLLDGQPVSHFGWYLHAMQQAGAGTGGVLAFVSELRSGAAPESALDRQAVPGAASFVRTTLRLARGTPAERIASLAIGREKLIPDAFPSLIRVVQRHLDGEPLGALLYYLEQHVEIDSGAHGPATHWMLRHYARGSVPAALAARDALAARCHLWDAALTALAPAG